MTDRRTEIQTPIYHPAISRCDKKELRLRFFLEFWEKFPIFLIGNEAE